MHRPVVILLVALAVAALPFDASALEPHARDGWILGLSYGGATGDITFADGFRGEVEDGVSSQIRVGHMLGNRFALGLGYSGWMYETGQLPYKYRFSLQNVLVNAVWYPGREESPLGGLHVRVGLGYAWSALAEVEIDDEEEQGHGDRIVDEGVAVELNLGYEFRVHPSAAVGLGLGVVAQDLDGRIYSEAAFTPFTLNLAWYWN